MANGLGKQLVSWNSSPQSPTLVSEGRSIPPGTDGHWTRGQDTRASVLALPLLSSLTVGKGPPALSLSILTCAVQMIIRAPVPQGC